MWTAVAKTIDVETASLSRLISCMGSLEFDRALLEVVGEVAPVQEILGFVWPDGGVPFAAGWTGARADAALRATQYVDHYHAHDPAMAALPEPASAEPGDVLYSVQKPDSVADRGYQWLYFLDPEYRLEVGVVRRTEDGWNLLKLYLALGVPAPTVKRVGELGSLIFPIAERHALNSDGLVSEHSRPRVVDRVSGLLADRYPALTDRERQVCAHTILGDSTKDIAESIGISVHTVLTYRRRAYKRLGVERAAELVKDLL